MAWPSLSSINYILSQLSCLAKGNMNVYFQIRFFYWVVGFEFRQVLLQVSRLQREVYQGNSWICAFQSVMISFSCIINILEVSHTLSHVSIYLNICLLMSKGVYEVQQIIDEAIINHQPHYLIKWKNYSHQHDTWEPLSDLESVADYLQFWISKKREQAKQNKKEKDKIDFDTVRKYVGRENMKSSKKSNLEKYAEEIRNKKKIWEKYIDNQEEAVEEEGSDETQPINPSISQKEPTYQNKSRRLQLCSSSSVAEQIQVQTPSTVPKPQQFKVVGSIDPSKVTKIIRVFLWQSTKCVQVELQDGRHYNMKEEELKKYQPLMLVQFYERGNIEF